MPPIFPGFFLFNPGNIGGFLVCRICCHPAYYLRTNCVTRGCENLPARRSVWDQLAYK
jgi:hypothetical protein